MKLQDIEHQVHSASNVKVIGENGNELMAASGTLRIGICLMLVRLVDELTKRMHLYGDSNFNAHIANPEVPGVEMMGECLTWNHGILRNWLHSHNICSQDIRLAS